MEGQKHAWTHVQMQAAYLLQLVLVLRAVNRGALQGRINPAGRAYRSSQRLPVRSAVQESLRSLLQQLLVLVGARYVPLQKAQHLLKRLATLPLKAFPWKKTSFEFLRGLHSKGIKTLLSGSAHTAHKGMLVPEAAFTSSYLEIAFLLQVSLVGVPGWHAAHSTLVHCMVCPTASSFLCLLCWPIFGLHTQSVSDDR